MKKNQKNKNAPITSLPDDLHSIWELTGELKTESNESVVSERETEAALQNIWASVDEPQQAGKLTILRYAVAAAIIIGAVMGFLNYFTINSVTAPGEFSEVQLPDGSSITLNGNSSIEYSLLFGITNRNIEINGHARFDVVSNERLPFVISSPSLTTTVIGTIFEIEDWKESRFTSPNVLVHEGIVKVQSESDGITLYQDEQTKLIDNELIELVLGEVAMEQSINWNDSRVSFKNIPLNQFFERLSHQFDVEIQIDQNINPEESVSGSYRFNTSLNEIILDVATIKNLELQRTNNGFIIK